MTDVDILVHASAPSRGPDDARYRALARAYLHFVPATRQRLEIEDEALRDELDEQVDNQLHEELRKSTQEEPESWESYRPHDEEDDHEIDESEKSELFPTQPTQPEPHNRVANLMALESPQLSFNSVGNNADSPEFRITCALDQRPIDGETQKSTDSWQMPPSTIADSQPEHNKTIGAFASPTRMLELYFQQIESSDQDSQESEVRHRQQSISETPARKLKNQLSRNSDIREFGYDEYADRSELPSMIRDTPARPVVSPILGNPTLSIASSPEVLSSLAPSSRMRPSQTPAMANNQLAFTSHQKTNVVTPSAAFSDPDDWTTDSPSTRRQRSAHEISRIVRNPALLSSQIPGPLQVSSPLLSTSSFGLQVPKASALESSSPMTPSSRTPTGRIPETPYHVPASPQSSAAGQKRSCPGVTSDNDQVLGSASIDVAVIPTSVESGKIQPQAKRRRIEEVSINRIPSSVPDIPLTKESSKEPAAKSQQRSQTESIASDFPMRSSPSVSNRISQSRSPTKSPLTSYSSHTTIGPAPPQTCNTSLDPISFITPCLISLSKKLPLSKLYRPTQQSRPLRPTERGYWLINCTPWSDALRKKCWDCLGNFVENGKAGWGVRCERHEEWQWIRIYCWGVVVDYVYLLLFMGSENKIRKVDCVWIGGDGNALITMPKIS